MWPIGGGQRTETAGAVSSGASRGTLLDVTATNTKSAYAQLIATTSFQAEGILIHAYPNDNWGAYLVDIAIGTAASEQVIVSNLKLTDQLSAGGVYLPLRVPAGSRLSARAQSSSGGDVYLEVVLFANNFGPYAGYQICDTYGADTTDSTAVSLDPGAVANTKGSYTQVTASTTRAHKMLVAVIGGQGNTNRTDCSWLMDIAIGAEGSEQIIVADLLIKCMSSSSRPPMPTYIYLPIGVPAATRIAARSQCTITDAADRLFDLEILGLS